MDLCPRRGDRDRDLFVVCVAQWEGNKGPMGDSRVSYRPHHCGEV